MNKNKILLSLLLLLFVFFIIRQINFSVRGQVIFGGGGRGGNVCYSTGATTQEECQSGQTGTGPIRRWRCSNRQENCQTDPGVPCTQWETRTQTVRDCCATDECGNCTSYCDREDSYRVCVDPNYRPPKYEACGPTTTACSCTECVTPTPCQRCPTNAPQPAATCQCLKLTPKKTSQELSFTCLVQVPEGASITDYTVTFKKPNGGLVNLKKKTITKVQGSNNYQVETTAITALEKGKYEMVVPPQITCQ